MPHAPDNVALLRLGRLELDPGLRALQPGSAASGLVVTATVEVPESVSEPQYAWDVAWADAMRQASELGADERTARALVAGAGNAVAGGTWVVVAAHGQVLLARWVPHGSAAASVRVGPLPHLRELAAFAARRPAHVVVLADRDGASVIAHAAGDQHPARRFRVDAQPDPHPGRPPAQHHGERHLTGPEPESGGERNAEAIAARVSAAAASVGAHLVLGAGEEHILDAVAGHLPASLRPVTTIASGQVPTQSDDELSARIGAALDGITAEAIGAVGGLVASSAAAAQDSVPAAVHGIDAVARELAEEQVAVLLLAADVARDGEGVSYRIGKRPTEFLVGDEDAGTEVPLDDGLVWAALHQDSIIVQMPDRSGPLADQPAAALLHRGRAYGETYPRLFGGDLERSWDDRRMDICIQYEFDVLRPFTPDELPPGHDALGRRVGQSAHAGTT
jgi:Bacterial archaeo-eukaryotic release factor family 2